MFAQIRAFLASPVFEDENKTRLAGLLNAIVWTLLAAVTALTGFMATFGAEFFDRRWGVVIGIVVIVTLSGLLGLVRRGQTHTASLLLVSLLWAAVSLTLFRVGRLDIPFATYYLVTILIAGLLSGGRAAFVVAFFSTLASLGLLFVETSTTAAAAAAASIVTRLPAWFSYTLSYWATAIILHLTKGNLDEIIQRAQDSEHFLAESNRQLQAIRASLEQHVNERTRDLERRTAQLQTAARVGNIATTIRDLDELLPQVTRLVSERFGYYHTGIFLLDPAKEYAELRAANSEGGQRMLARRHRLRVGQEGIVGHVAGSREPRIALDVGKDAVYFDNPDMPQTHSEMALPLMVRGQILGVLDVQSTEVAAFIEEDIAILRVLADQVAVAIDNARLFAENQAALDAIRRAYGELSQQAWEKLLLRRPDLGYISTAQDANYPVSGEWRPEMVQARDEARIITLPDDPLTLVVPLEIRDHAVGAIRLRKEAEAGEWSADEIELMKALTDQLGVALESARLYRDTQQRAERERLVTEITTKIRATNDPETIVQTAVSELRAALQARQVRILSLEASAGSHGEE